MIKLVCLLLFIFQSICVIASTTIRGKVSSEYIPLENAKIDLLHFKDSSILFSTYTDSVGFFQINNIHNDIYILSVQIEGFISFKKIINNSDNIASFIDVVLESKYKKITDIVITGTLHQMNKLNSPVPVEVYKEKFFMKNPGAHLFESLQMVNGIRPQINCNVCNTGDIHINGLEGPYTMFLIDGMPIMSSLAGVYGLFGIPNTLIERVEVMKGPASAVYGSEAVGGVINVITKNINKATPYSFDYMFTSWQEQTMDLGLKLLNKKKVQSFLGAHIFYFNQRVDRNNDNFTDAPLQKRISLFNKWNIGNTNGNSWQTALRFINENRSGGELQWRKKHWGSDSIYGEAINTHRFEFINTGSFRKYSPLKFNSSLVYHHQNAAYGKQKFIATQWVGFLQCLFQKKWNLHDILLGTGVRYNFYNDNTPVTQYVSIDSSVLDNPDIMYMPGLFVQDVFKKNKTTLLLGLRYDYHSKHKSIITPRAAMHYKLNEVSVIRGNIGTGYRVVNIFAEEHAALTGARNVIINNNLLPERSVNMNLNFYKSNLLSNMQYVNTEISVFYTYFYNKIFADYNINPNEIHFYNIQGHAINKGVSISLDGNITESFNIYTGATCMWNEIFQNGKKENQILSERFSMNWAFSYNIKKYYLAVDYSGSLYSPMRLPLASMYDPRPSYSTWWSLHNIQLSYSKLKHITFFAGVKNIFDWTPARSVSFLIARAHDPFDKKVEYATDGSVLVTAENPYAMTFDPSYVYAPNQGRRIFAGMRFR